MTEPQRAYGSQGKIFSSWTFTKYFADFDLDNCLSFLFAFLWPLSGVMDTTYDRPSTQTREKVMTSRRLRYCVQAVCPALCIMHTLSYSLLPTTPSYKQTEAQRN